MGGEIELVVSCAECVRRGTADCDDCLVSYVCGGAPELIQLDESAAEIAALFVAEGLLPQSRFVAIRSSMD